MGGTQPGSKSSSRRGRELGRPILAGCSPTTTTLDSGSTIMSMQAYLAAKYVHPSTDPACLLRRSLCCGRVCSSFSYMSGAKADAILARSTDKKKKRKRRDDSHSTNAHASGSGLRLADEHDPGWGHEDDPKDEDDAPGELTSPSLHHRDDSDTDSPRLGPHPTPVVETSKETFIPANKSAWTTVHSGETPPPEDEAVPQDEQPQMVDTDAPPSPPAPRRGGLRTAAQLRAEEEAAAREELANKAAATEADAGAAEEAERLAQETVYRDGSGKKVDMKKEKAEERRRKKERDDREARKLEWGKGVVQRGEKEEQAKREKEEAGRDLARSVVQPSFFHLFLAVAVY